MTRNGSRTDVALGLSCHAVSCKDLEFGNDRVPGWRCSTLLTLSGVVAHCESPLSKINQIPAGKAEDAQVNPLLMFTGTLATLVPNLRKRKLILT